MAIFLLLYLLGMTAAQRSRPPVIKEHPSSIVARRNDPATLNCAASGAARIRWFRDGEEVATSTQDSRSHRVLLPSGSLFFLRVTATKRESDAGTYWCVASNSYGVARSHNATLTVATLAYDFQRQAEPLVKVRVGDSLILPCQPPKGSPPPELTWFRDGLQVSNSSRVSLTEAGDLVIIQAVQEDSAAYVCRAHNAAGTRESPPTQLTVMTPPWLEERPANVTVPSGVMAELVCRARGFPAPTLTWRRLDGKIPLGRSTIEDERLMLEQVTSVDSGVYVCEVENEAGITGAQATLTVIDAPQLTQRPQDIQVMAGVAAQISCYMEGMPQPLVLWRLPTLDRTALLTAGQSSGHVSISNDGHTLKLKPTATQDSGTYYCWGVSSGGGVNGKAEVVVVPAHPPPAMGVGPQDLTVAPGSVASFPCEVVSEAAEVTISWWYRAAAHLPPRQLSQDSADPRFSLPDNGALIIKDVRRDDAGIYTCHVTATTGTVEQEAILQVKEDAYAVGPLLLPPPPTKPRLVAVNQTAVQLSWLPNSQVGENLNQWYTVEYWRQGWDEWRVADAVIKQESCVVSHLTLGYTYTFMVRAVSNRGASFPSPWSDPVNTRSPRDPSLTMDQVRRARRRLSRPIVTITSAVITAPDSVQLNWNFLAPTDESVEGVLIYSLAEIRTVQVATVLGTSSFSHLLHDLRPHTPYIFFVVPFWRSVEGTPSNSYSLTTPEDIPMAAPGDVRVTVREEGFVLIRWSSLSVEEARGEVLGYQVTISHNGSHTTETVVNLWLEARGLLPGRLYTVRVAALTGAGLGPFSNPTLVDVRYNGANSRPTDARDDDASPHPAWLAYLIIPMVLLLLLSTLWYVRRLGHQTPSSHPPHAPSLYQEQSIYCHHSVMYSEPKLWYSSENDKDNNLSSTLLMHPDQLVSEYAEPRAQQQSQSMAEPYATAALLAPESPRLKHDISWRCNSDDSGVQVNWADILPPPPSCPPPIDLDLGDPTSDSDLQRTRGFSSPSRCITMDGSSQCITMDGSSQCITMDGSQPRARSSDATSGHTYMQVIPGDSSDGVIAFSTQRGHDYHKVQAEFHIPRQENKPQSSTH
ncbi:roundabout homolog 2-like [Panulirus ornatus]|uniref:roundabout homolog 2-like n=1 Tax=Panulirus ornatus TaxID=150431 RepID=UPI003A8BD3B1